MLFCVKTYKSNCYIAQLFLDQSPIVQLDVVVRSEFPDGQQKMAVSSHLSSLVHKRIGNTKSPRSLSSTGSADFCKHGGQIAVTVVNSAGIRGAGGRGSGQSEAPSSGWENQRRAKASAASSCLGRRQKYRLSPSAGVRRYSPLLLPWRRGFTRSEKEAVLGR